MLLQVVSAQLRKFAGQGEDEKMAQDSCLFIGECAS